MMRHELERGARLWGAGHYWEAHEAWEGVWMAAKARGDAQEAHYVQGLILLAAALHKARVQGSARGGQLNLAKARRHLEKVPDHYGAPDGLPSLEGLMQDVERALEPNSSAPKLI